MNFLVADDDLIIRVMFRKYLHADGHVCFEAENGLEALEIIKQHSVDVVISDIMMPEMDGIGLALELKKLKVRIPVFAITAGSPLVISEEYPGIFKTVFSKMLGFEKILKKIYHELS